MATYGVNLKIDVSKIDKSKLFKGEKGTYLDLTAFINVDEQGQYGDNGMITQSWKDQQKGEGPILGNAKVFWRDDGQQPQQGQPKQQQMPEPDDLDSDSIPF